MRRLRLAALVVLSSFAGSCQSGAPPAALGSDGSACSGDDECASAHCQNGYCCAGGDCCASAADCAAYAAAPACDDPVSCQGWRHDAVCSSSICGAQEVEDDSACAGVVSDCGPYPAAPCSGAQDQPVPCATACTRHLDCDADAYCDFGEGYPRATVGVCVAAACPGGAAPEDDHSVCTRDVCTPAGTPLHVYDPLCGYAEDPAPSLITPETISLNGVPYDSYGVDGDTFRIVCQQPCPVPEDVILAMHAGMSRTRDVLVSFTGIDVLPALVPVDVHITADEECGAFMQYGYAGWSSFTSDHRGEICLFSWEWSTPPAPYVPRPLTPESEVQIENNILFAHEYAHVIQFARMFSSWESIASGLSMHLEGVMHGLCDPQMADYNAELLYQLCRQSGMTYEDLRASLQAVDALYEAGLGEQDLAQRRIPTGPPPTSPRQWRLALEQILQAPTLDVFLDYSGLHHNEVGDSVTLLPAGGTFEMYRGEVSLSVPAGAIDAAVTIDTPPVATLSIGDVGWADFVFAHVQRLEPAATVFGHPVELRLHYDASVLPVGADESTLHLWGGPTCTTAGLIAGSTVDPATDTVSGTIDALGCYYAAP